MNLIVIPFHDWKKCEREGFRTRDAHFMQEFGKHSLVQKLLIVNRPLSMAEMLLMRRSRRPQTGTAVFQQNGVVLTQVSPKTYTLDVFIPQLIKPLWLNRNWISYIFGHQKVIQAVQRALTYLDMSAHYSVFMSAPLYVPLVEQLAPHVLAFDAQDNLLKHPQYRNVSNLKTYYDYCLDRADFISANSQETANWFKQRRPDAQHIPNGVDNEKFNTEMPHRFPSDVKRFTSPVVGYAGKMQEMFDVPLMLQVVSEMPEVNFVFIGQQLAPQWMKPLWRHKNAHYLGDKSYEDLPDYLAAFDICIIPYDAKRQHGGDPIKFYEYLAMGKPIVTSNIGNVNVFQDYPQVYISSSPELFKEGLKHFVRQIQQQVAIPKWPVPPEHLWRSKADNIISAIVQRPTTST
ncbi:MAG: glycosyltransferase [Anaerolineae bacterium]|nr:glycosyltransferase [Anaerolineae bacterium]